MINRSRLKASLAFSKNILTTGAITQTSKRVEKEITKQIDPLKKQIIVEYGTGHGNITKEILAQMNPDSKLYSFEVNKEFSQLVQAEIIDDRAMLINAGAERISEFVKEDVDVFISSLPITIFPKGLADEIIKESYNKLLLGGTFSQILYTLIHKKKFSKYFKKMNITRFYNIPMEYVHHCHKIN